LRVNEIRADDDKINHLQSAQKEMPRDPMVDELQLSADVGREWLRVKRWVK